MYELDAHDVAGVGDVVGVGAGGWGVVAHPAGDGTRIVGVGFGHGYVVLFVVCVDLGLVVGEM